MPVALAMAAAAAVIVSVALWNAYLRPRTNGEPGPALVQVGDVSPVREINTSDEFASLETRVQQLGLELAALVPQAELLDARHQVNELLNQYSQW